MPASQPATSGRQDAAAMVEHEGIPLQGPQAAGDDVGVLPELGHQRLPGVGRAAETDGQRADQRVVAAELGHPGFH